MQCWAEGGVVLSSVHLREMRDVLGERAVRQGHEMPFTWAEAPEQHCWLPLEGEPLWQEEL